MELNTQISLRKSPKGWDADGLPHPTGMGICMLAIQPCSAAVVSFCHVLALLLGTSSRSPTIDFSRHSMFKNKS